MTPGEPPFVSNPSNAAPDLLRGILGPATIVFVSLSVAIGSGIFATPGDISSHLASPWIILAAWLLGGALTYLQCLVTAELATRLPLAGGEYQFLKAAYGDFAAFFFGWSYTIFIVGGGAGTIAAALGRFAAELFGLAPLGWPVAFGCASIVLVTAVNASGLRAGAVVQNILSALKVAALLAIAIGVTIVSKRITPLPTGPSASTAFGEFMPAFVLVYWAYSGTTDSAKLAEETTDVRRSLPKALLLSAGTLTLVYCLFNYALYCGATPIQMRGHESAATAAFGHERGAVDKIILIVSILICLGSIGSTLLSNVRVMYAMARDGLTFSSLGRMSPGQSPTASLIVVAAVAAVFVLNRSFGEMVYIYFLASTVLFGMSYVSLIVLRRRDQRSGRPFPAHAFRAPAGVAIAALLVLWEIVVAWTIASEQLKAGKKDSLYTLGVLAGIAAMYPIWKRVTRHRPTGAAI